MSSADAERSLERHMNWLYGPGGVYPGAQMCLCDYGFMSLGRLYGVDMGRGWVRINTHPECPHHAAGGCRPRRIRRVK